MGNRASDLYELSEIFLEDNMKIGHSTLLCQRLLIVLIITGSLCLILSNSAMALPAEIQEQVLRTLTVTGQGVKKIPTTITQVQLGVEVQDKTAVDVQQEVAKRTSALIDLLRSRKVEQLKTTGIHLQPNYQYKNNQQQFMGYTGTNTVSFRFNTEQVAEVLDRAVKVGATRIDGLSFTATEEVISSAQKEALRLATVDAQQQSDAVLKALNFVAKEIVSIHINGANVPSPRTFQAEQFSKNAASFSTPIIGGEQDVQATVTLQISY